MEEPRVAVSTEELLVKLGILRDEPFGFCRPEGAVTTDAVSTLVVDPS